MKTFNFSDCFLPLIIGLFLGISPISSKPLFPGLLYIPTADILPHGRFQVSSGAHFFLIHKISNGDTSRIIRLPVSSSVILGFQDKAQFGMQYGDEVSLSFKAYVYDAPETSLMPDAVLGIRSLFGSQEGWLYGINDPIERKKLKNEAFLTLNSKLGTTTRFHFGGSVVSQGDENLFNTFAAIEQYFAGFYFNWEAFRRYGELHHHLLIFYNVSPFFTVSIGFSEFQRWLKQNGKWGFFSTSKDPVFNGYNSPGLRLAVTMGSWVNRQGRQKKWTKIREFEKKQIALADSVVELKNRIQELQKNVASLKPIKSQFKRQDDRVFEILEQIKVKVNSDLPFDPREIAELNQRILAERGSGKSLLKKIVINPASDVAYRIQCCIIMGISGQNEFIEPLLKATADPEPQVRIEAILALSKLKAVVALEFAESLLDDPDKNVQLAAKEAIRTLKAHLGKKLIEDKYYDTP